MVSELSFGYKLLDQCILSFLLSFSDELESVG